MAILILCAAGKGKRLGKDLPKALVPIKNKPIFYYSLKNVFSSKVKKVIIAAPKGWEDVFKTSLKKHFNKKELVKVSYIISGGKERQDSVYKGLVKIYDENFKNNPIILVHNAANIFAKKSDFNKVIEGVKKDCACAVALPSVDTLRKLGKNFKILKKLEREKIWRTQTPQGARLSVLMKAFKKAKKENFIGTDELELISRLGEKVKIIPGTKLNFKITFKQDFLKAKALINLGNSHF
ncbi:MAG: 2-C-methyl-D-erythritol 4-phosphate cytidylyltransferase [Candidatus Moranbacteria bacterium]|nr:2-C-methyl-D-erythritol 4-phosphate cytidylyltransferase [Candidatus Moranbacteria bacterium]